MKRSEYNTLIFSLLVFLTLIQVLTSLIFKLPFSWPLYLLTIFLLMFLFFVKVEKVAVVFKAFFEKLQSFNNFVFMAIVYFVVLSPVGFLRRTTRGHKVRTSVKKANASYLEEPGVRSKDFTRPF